MTITMSPSSCWTVERVLIFGIGGDARLYTSSSIEKSHLAVEADGVAVRGRSCRASQFGCFDHGYH